MPTTLDIAFIVLGGVLLLVSVVGGRFKLFGAEVAGEAGRIGRLMAGWGMPDHPGVTSETPAAVTRPNATQASATLYNCIVFPRSLRIRC